MKKGLLLIAAIIFIAFNSNAQLLTDDFQDDNISDWTTVTPTYASYNTTWHVGMYNNGTPDDNTDDQFYLRASCYADNANHATEQWIISPSFDTSGKTSITVEFDNRKRFSPYQDVKLFVSTTASGDSASFDASDWTEMTGFDLDDNDNDYNWAEGVSATVSISGSSNTYIAFKYVSTNDAGGVWDIDNVVVTGTASVNNITTNTKLFPNPTSSVLNIQSQVNIASIKVANVIGQKVLSINNVNADNYKLNVEDLNNGVYLISINNVDGTSAVTKFVKK